MSLIFFVILNHLKFKPNCSLLSNIYVDFFALGSLYPLEAALKNGGARDQATMATLTITPTKEDDDAVFRCEVWNRALPEDKKLVSTVTLSVNCKYMS